MNTQQEIQLKDNLRQLVAGHPVGPDIDMAIRRAHRVRRRGIALRGAAGLGVVALAAGAVVIGTRGAPGTAAKNSAAKNSPASQAETVAYVIKHTDAALANVSHYIVRDDVTSPSGAFTLWTDPRTGNTYLEQGSGSGRLAAWGSTYLTGNVLHWRTVQVNYGPAPGGAR